ncbi:MAG: hypothetical protein AUJ51_08745 [Elusimicrobia bacterium CG1_02_56_21]|nr:MAG: hypothetical protein AUJ51_08745 [Elusimicrobia bacterium CG1_02_56_21]
MKANLLIILVAPFLLAGCAHVTPAVSSMSFSPEAMEVMGVGSGESSQTYLFCFIPVGPAYSTLNAVKGVVETGKGDALINTVAEHETFWAMPFMCRHTIRVNGTVIKFKKNSPPLK